MKFFEKHAHSLMIVGGSVLDIFLLSGSVLTGVLFFTKLFPKAISSFCHTFYGGMGFGVSVGVFAFITIGLGIVVVVLRGENKKVPSDDDQAAVTKGHKESSDPQRDLLYTRKPEITEDGAPAIIITSKQGEKFLAFSDSHIKDRREHSYNGGEEIFGSELIKDLRTFIGHSKVSVAELSGLLIVGDLVTGPVKTAKVLNELQQDFKIPVLHVPGNCEFSRDYSSMKADSQPIFKALNDENSTDVYLVNKTTHHIANTVVVGLPWCDDQPKKWTNAQKASVSTCVDARLQECATFLSGDSQIDIVIVMGHVPHFKYTSFHKGKLATHSRRYRDYSIGEKIIQWIKSNLKDLKDKKVISICGHTHEPVFASACVAEQSIDVHVLPAFKKHNCEQWFKSCKP